MFSFLFYFFGEKIFEALVEITIIGILTTLLLLSLSKVSKAVIAKVCLSNLKQIGLAAYTYSTDNRDKPQCLLDTHI